MPRRISLGQNRHSPYYYSRRNLDSSQRTNLESTVRSMYNNTSQSNNQNNDNLVPSLEQNMRTISADWATQRVISRNLSRIARDILSASDDVITDMSILSGAT